MTSEFPRALTSFESAAIERLLPATRRGYARYREFVNTSIVIGEGRWGAGDLLLAPKVLTIDPTAGMTPVVAFGEFVTNVSDREIEVTVTINEPQDEQMEVQFSSEESLADLATASIHRSWTISDWEPLSDPAVREIPFSNQSHNVLYVLAINATRRMLWLHHTDSGFNQLIPVTGFYEYLLRSHPPKDKKAALSARAFFGELPALSDSTLRNALLNYNLENRKFDASTIATAEPTNAGFFVRLKQTITRKNG